MIDDWLTGALALVGALGGVLLSTWLTRLTKRADLKRHRLEEALRAVTVAISAQHFATRFGTPGKRPDFVTEREMRELHSRVYLKNLERLSTTLYEARLAVAALEPDGIEVGESWHGDEQMQSSLVPLYWMLTRKLGLRAPHPIPE